MAAWDMLKQNYSEWIGRTQTERDRLGEDTARMLHATVGAPGTSVPSHDREMPPLWHWCAFNPAAPMDELSTDGHPKRGGFLPPIRLERRMWAGGQLEFLRPVKMHVPLTRTSTIEDVVEKTGTTGEMVFVTLRHEIATDEGLAIRETQNIVYLPLPTEFAPPPKKPVFDTHDFARDVEMSETLLFRYSAATFNAHRIHYDLAYAQQVEKYPGLVVHGPLQATLLMGAAMAQSGKRPRSFVFRGVHPMFHTDPLCLFGRETKAGMELCTGIRGGHQGTSAKITWEDDQ